MSVCVSACLSVVVCSTSPAHGNATGADRPRQSAPSKAKQASRAESRSSASPRMQYQRQPTGRSKPMACQAVGRDAWHGWGLSIDPLALSSPASRRLPAAAGGDGGSGGVVIQALSRLTCGCCRFRQQVGRRRGKGGGQWFVQNPAGRAGGGEVHSQATTSMKRERCSLNPPIRRGDGQRQQPSSSDRPLIARAPRGLRMCECDVLSRPPSRDQPAGGFLFFNPAH